MIKRHRLWLAFFCLLLINHAVAASTLTYQETRIPLAGTNGLAALLVWPDDGKPHPLALINHGSPRDAAARKKMSAIAGLPIALEFARRGFAVAYVLRRGYGNSGGNWAEDKGRCNAPDYLHSAAAATADLNAIIKYLGTQPQFNTHQILAVGVSAGGFSTVALTANPPPGLIAAISFAGGRGSKANDVICTPERLIEAFRVFGKTSRTPMLWIYAENDHFFNPTIARQFYTAFTQSGGNATLLMAPPYGEEGHFLFSTAGIPIWTPLVDDFLKTHHFVLVDHLLPLSVAPKRVPPPSTTANQQ
jgi:dienelactone hydrolase